MISLDDFTAMQRKVETLRTRRDQVRGALDAAKARLKKEYGCDTAAAGVRLLKKREAEERDLAEEYTAKREAFDRKWKSKVDAELGAP